MNTHTILDARVVAEPKTFSLKDGKSITKVRLADNPPGGKKERPTKGPAIVPRFTTGKAFGKQGETLAKLSKGDVITATGSLQTEEFDQKDGTRGSDEVLLIDRFRVQKSESFFAGKAQDTAPEAQSMDDLFGGTL